MGEVEFADGTGTQNPVSETTTDLIPDETPRSSGEHVTFLVHDKSEEETVGSFHLINLTCGLGGLQVVWSVILSNGSPFLVSLGLSKSFTALVWLAAPLCGSIIQPIVGSISDRTTSRFGRRRPFILAGTFGVVLSMVLLAWTEQIIYQSFYLLGYNTEAPILRTLVICFAIFWIYTLNVSIQPIQAGIRSLIVERCPLHQQSQACSYASVMTGIGNIFGYLFGYGILAEVRTSNVTSFQFLCLFASVCLFATTMISCITISEKGEPSGFKKDDTIRGPWAMLQQLKQTYKYMSKRIRNVCHVQFFAWMGWFPFLFYSTTFVSEYYAGNLEVSETAKSTNRTILGSNSALKERKGVGPEAIRYGTFASFLFAIIAFFYNLILPKILERLSSPRSNFQKPKDTTDSVIKLWTTSHGFFALLMFATFFTSSQATATVVVALTGLSWAITLFAPFTIINTEISALQGLHKEVTIPPDDPAFSASTELAHRTGAVMGLHNVAISAPQILAALACSAIYGIMKALDVVNGTGWVLRAGGVAALGAAWRCRGIDR